MKAAKILATIPSNDWRSIESFMAKILPDQVATIPEGKIRLGLSTYGLAVNTKRQNASALELKKIIKSMGRSVRVVPNSGPELNSAQVIHNKLTNQTGIEFLLIKNEGQTILAQTFAIQDIEAYAARDQARPKRDARVGMLPPKLAQIIINLAVGSLEEKRRKTEDSEQHKPPTTIYHLPPTILDPFCGTGVVLQEALLMGYQASGTDLEPRMIEYSNENLDWLAKHYGLDPANYNLSAGDATDHQWFASPNSDPQSPAFYIAGETYLGQPFSVEPSSEKLQQVMSGVNLIHRKFLQNVTRQTKPGFRMCIAVPSWKTKHGFKHLKVLDSLEELGYTRISFAHARDEDLIYHREGQLVARELVTLIRK